MSKVKLLVGIQASGKTTYAKYLEDNEGYVRISVDDVIRCTSDKSVYENINDIVISHIKNGRDVVIDGTYSTKTSRSKVITPLHDMDVEIEICLFARPVEDCFKRNENREHSSSVSNEHMKRFLDMFQKPTADECDILTVITDEWFNNNL